MTHRHSNFVLDVGSIQIVQVRIDSDTFEAIGLQQGSEHRFVVKSIPFFLRGLSLLDEIVRTADQHIQVVQSSGRSNARLLFQDRLFVSTVLNKLNAMGCLIEAYNGFYFGVDMPSEDVLAAATRVFEAMSQTCSFVWEISNCPSDPRRCTRFPSELEAHARSMKDSRVEFFRMARDGQPGVAKELTGPPSGYEGPVVPGDLMCMAMDYLDMDASYFGPSDAAWTEGDFALHIRCGDDASESPHREYDQLVCRAVPPERFELMCTPTHAYGLARGDVVQRRAYGEVEVVRPGGHRALRVFWSQGDWPAIAHAEELGCHVDTFGEGFYGLDCSDTAIFESTWNWLNANEGDFEFELVN